MSDSDFDRGLDDNWSGRKPKPNQSESYYQGWDYGEFPKEQWSGILEDCIMDVPPGCLPIGPQDDELPE